MKLLEMTSLIPARDDATENDAFKAYFEENPADESLRRECTVCGSSNGQREIQ